MPDGIDDDSVDEVTEDDFIFDLRRMKIKESDPCLGEGIMCQRELRLYSMQIGSSLATIANSLHLRRLNINDALNDQKMSSCSVD